MAEKNIDFEPTTMLDGDILPSNNRKRKITIAIVCVLVAAILAGITAGLVKYFVYTTLIVDGVSMYPTLDGGNGAFDDADEHNGEKLLVDKVAKINRGDVVVFRPGWRGIGHDPNVPYAEVIVVKRVIGIAGDHIKIVTENGIDVVYLNGQKLYESYINEPMYSSPKIELIVPNGAYVCFGDNRNRSSDCRFYEPFYVTSDKFIGKVVLVKGLDGKLRKP